jgi:small subunit ribosomal protein S4
MEKSGDKRELLFKKLEKRLDNAIFRLGFAKSRLQARQIVNHSHIIVNDRRMTIPSYEVKIGDVISFKPKFKKTKIVEDIGNFVKKNEIPAWLSCDYQKLEGKVVSDVLIEDPKEIQSLGMIIEFYSR